MTPWNKKIISIVGRDNVDSFRISPFNDLVCTYLSHLSTQLRTDERSKKHPEILALAFFLRSANLARLKKSFNLEEYRIGLGRIFHITPSNVPVNFAYSYSFGLLSGNSNVVRLPSNQFDQSDVICEHMGHLLSTPKYESIRAMTALIKYEQNKDITEFYCSQSDGRMIWGGDKTVQTIKRINAPSKCVDLVFPDRYSIAVLDSESIFNCTEQEIFRLAEGFYRDSYLMDQNACSSPHLVVWLKSGKNTFEAREKFWKTLSKIAETKYNITSFNAVSKYTQLCRDATKLGMTKIYRHSGNRLYRIELSCLPESLDSFRGRCGYFYEFQANALRFLKDIVTPKYQTLTYYGLDQKDIANEIIKNQLPGIDRVVPVGQALDIGLIWDGYDIIRKLSRVIEVKI